MSLMTAVILMGLLAGDAKPTDAKPTDAKPTDAKPTDAKPTDAKPAEKKDRTAMTPAELLTAADKNSDGGLSLEEFQAGIFASPKHAPQAFKKCDRNSDSRLSVEELTAALESVPWWKMSRKTPEEFLKSADKDGDGRLSREEFKTVCPHKNHADKHFERTDRNDDKALSLEEFSEYVRDIVAEK